jgi:hypothetical protein
MEPIGVGQSGNFFWWEGVVEDNLDPLGAGRCKVRVLGHNTPLKTEVPTNELPWAYPMMPLNNPHGKIVALKPGTRIFGFFRDGATAQDLMMLGSINIGYDNPGQLDNYDEEITDPPTFTTGAGDVPIILAAPTPRVPLTWPKGDLGFVDDRLGTGGPIETQPKKAKVLSDANDDPARRGFLKHVDVGDYGPLQPNEINTPRLARGISEGTVSATHAQTLSVVNRLQTFSGSETSLLVPEPKTKFAAQYPFNTVEESDSGHLREIDDTPGAERIKETHRTGTFYEIHPDGTKVTKIVKDNFEVTIGDKSVKVEGVCAVEVVGEADFYCHEDVRIRTDKNAYVDTRFNAEVTVGMNADVTVGNDLMAVVERDLNARGKGDVLVIGEKEVKVVSKEDMLIAAGGEITFQDTTATAKNVDHIIEDHIKKKNRRVDASAGTVEVPD